MASIPLHCNICPQEPNFSDVSHLLTHIASKGHLSHYFKSQVRAPQDENVKNRVEVYDHWFNHYDIQSLLSQRMDAKQNKPDIRAKAPRKRAPSSRARKVQKPRGRPSKTETHLDNGCFSPVKQETSIDPLLATANVSDTLQDSPSFAAASRRRAPIPYMHDWQNQTPMALQHTSTYLPSNLNAPRKSGQFGASNDSENDYFRTFIKSPSPLTYPEPPQNPFKHVLPSKPESAASPCEKAGQSPILKGVKYPGMHLFDAASREAQRLRNQKKDDSTLAQMEIDAAAIEPLEQIWFPEGRLKKQRTITGNVESSPIIESTSEKRPRNTGSRQALREISANIQRPVKNRGRKNVDVGPINPLRLEHMADLAMQTLKTAYPRNAHMGYNPSIDGMESRSLKREPMIKARRELALPIFRDSLESESITQVNIVSKPRQQGMTAAGSPQAGTQTFTRASTSFQSSSPLFGQATPTFSAETSNERRQTGLSTQSQQTLTTAKGKAILPSTYRDNSHIEGTAEQPHGLRQMYHSAFGDQARQYSSSMPAQTDFEASSFPSQYVNPMHVYQPGRYQHVSFPSDRYHTEGSLHGPSRLFASQRHNAASH